MTMTTSRLGAYGRRFEGRDLGERRSGPQPYASMRAGYPVPDLLTDFSHSFDGLCLRILQGSVVALRPWHDLQPASPRGARCGARLHHLF
jgi:hypothetical protein